MSLFKHYHNGKKYRELSRNVWILGGVVYPSEKLRGDIQVQINDQWVPASITDSVLPNMIPAVLYECVIRDALGGDMKFVRSREEFNKKFQECLYD